MSEERKSEVNPKYRAPQNSSSSRRVRSRSRSPRRNRSPTRLSSVVYDPHYIDYTVGQDTDLFGQTRKPTANSRNQLRRFSNKRKPTATSRKVAELLKRARSQYSSDDTFRSFIKIIGNMVHHDCDQITNYGARCSRAFTYSRTVSPTNKIQKNCTQYCLENCEVWMQALLDSYPKTLKVQIDLDELHEIYNVQTRTFTIVFGFDNNIPSYDTENIRVFELDQLFERQIITNKTASEVCQEVHTMITQTLPMKMSKNSNLGAAFVRFVFTAYTPYMEMADPRIIDLIPKQLAERANVHPSLADGFPYQIYSVDKIREIRDQLPMVLVTFRSPNYYL
jgi:hypothetical protein